METLDHLVRGLDGPPSWEDEAESQRRHRLQYRLERRHEVYEINFWTVVAQLEQYLLVLKDFNIFMQNKKKSFMGENNVI